MVQFAKRVEKFVHWSGMSVNATANNSFYQEMFDAAIRDGPGVHTPTLMNTLQGEIKTLLKEYTNRLPIKWKKFGCTDMLDRRMTQNKMSIINFIFHCDGQTIIVHSICLQGENNITCSLKDT